jgi:hypothetical protein
MAVSKIKRKDIHCLYRIKFNNYKCGKVQHLPEKEFSIAIEDVQKSRLF